MTNGVRQGRIVCPTLLNLVYATMFSEATKNFQCIVYIRFCTSGKLFNLSRLRASTKVFEKVLHEFPYADDCALEAHSQQDIQLITDRFAEAAKPYGILTNLLYGCETWTCYRRHIKALDRFHMRHLRMLLKIKWQDRITNAEVLERSQSTGIEALLIGWVTNEY